MSNIINVSELTEEYISDYVKKGFFTHKSIYIWGCNAYTRPLCQMLLGMNLKIEGIVDNNPVKAGGEVEGISVVLPMNIQDKNGLVVFCLSRAIIQISKQLKDIGFDNSVIFDCRNKDVSEKDMNFTNMEKKLGDVERQINLLQKKYSKNILILLFPYISIGDAYLVSLYLKAYIQNRDYCILTTTRSSKIIFERFELCCIELVSDELMKWFCIYERFSHGGGYNNIITIVPKYHYTDSSFELRNVSSLHITDYYRTVVLGLDRFVNWEFPKLKQSSFGEKIDVIFAPYANSLAGFPMRFWEGAVEQLVRYGKTVYTNCGDNEKEITGTLPLKVSLDELDTVVNNAGIFVGMRSGVCDVIAHTKTQKIIIYPNQMAKEDIDFVSLKWLDDSVEELVYNDAIEFSDNLVENIMRKLENDGNNV